MAHSFFAKKTIGPDGQPEEKAPKMPFGLSADMLAKMLPPKMLADFDKVGEFVAALNTRLAAVEEGQKKIIEILDAIQNGKDSLDG